MVIPVDNEDCDRLDARVVGGPNGPSESDMAAGEVDDVSVPNSEECQRFFRLAHAVSVKLPFTDETARQERKRAFAMIMEFGPPAFMLTVSHNGSCNKSDYFE